MPNPNILFQNMPSPSLSENFESALGTQQKLNEFRNMPMKNRLLQNEVAASDIGLQQAQREVGLQEQDQQRKQYLQQIGDMAVDAVGLLPLIEAGDVGQITTALEKRIEKIRARGGDPSDTMDFRDRFLSGKTTKEQAIDELNSVVSAAERMGIIKGLGGRGMQDFNEKAKGLSPEDRQRALRIDLGLDPRASLSAEERIAQDQSMTQKVAESKSVISGSEAGAAERAKLGARMEQEPELEAAKTRATEAAKLEAKIKEKITTAGRDAAGVNSILDMAEELIPLSTQSGIGTAADIAAGVVGVSTKGAEVADSLRSLEGALIMKMPRMEGPQSNYDVELYRQMAARIGDSTVPAPRRIAALKTLRELTNKYAVKTDKAQATGEQAKQFTSPSGVTFTVE